MIKMLLGYRKGLGTCLKYLEDMEKERVLLQDIKTWIINDMASVDESIGVEEKLQGEYLQRKINNL